MAQIENIFDEVLRACILLIELAGVLVIVVSVVRGIVDYIKKSELTGVRLARGIMMGLEFKLGGEVIRSVLVTSWDELGKLAAIIVLRTALTLLLRWEISVDEKRQHEKALAEAQPETKGE